MLLLASLPRVVKIFKISAFYLAFSWPTVDLDRRSGKFPPAEPSGMEEKTEYRLSTRVSLNLSVSFFNVDSLISSLVDSSFCFLIYYLSYYSTFSREAITLLSLVCSYLALAKSPCKIYTIFWFLDFSLVSLLKSFFNWDISPSKVDICFSSPSLVSRCSLISLSFALIVFSWFWTFYYNIFCSFFAF